jgi:hypothetical protein
MPQLETCAVYLGLFEATHAAEERNGASMSLKLSDLSKTISSSAPKFSGRYARALARRRGLAMDGTGTSHVPIE